MLVKRAFKALSLLTYAAIFWIQPQLARAQTDAAARVQSLRYQTTGDSTRIELAIDGNVEYRGERISNPDRIFFDLSGAKLGSGFGKREVIVENELLKRIRIAQNQPDVVRIVLDLSGAREYSVSELQNPNRMVIDLFGPGGLPSQPALQASGIGNQRTEKKEDTGVAAEQAAVNAVEDVTESETDSGAKRAQITDIKEQRLAGMAVPEADSPDIGNGAAQIRNIRYRASDDSMQVVIAINGDVEYRGERISNPDRIFFDISAAKLSADFGNRNIAVENELLKRIRVSQNRPDVVRVVLDVAEVGEYSVLEMDGPDRMVVDLYGLGRAVSKPALQESGLAIQDTEKKEDTGMVPARTQPVGAESTDQRKPEAIPGVESSQIVDIKGQRHTETETLEVNPENVPNGPAQIQSLQYLGGGDHAQIIIAIDGNTEYQGERIGNPDRIFFDISAAKLGPDFGNRNLVVENELLKKVRVAQNRQNVVRVVLDVSEVSEYSVSEEQGPNRMVIDLYGPAGVPTKPVPQQASFHSEDVRAVAESDAKPLESEPSVVNSDTRPIERERSVAESAKTREPDSEPETESVQAIDKKEQKPTEAGFSAENSADVRSGPAWVRSLRYQITGNSAQVIILLDGEVEYKGERIGNPERIFFDLSGAKLSSGFGIRNVVVENELLKRIRVAQNRPDVVRVVLDITEKRGYSVAELRGPSRMVIDLHGPSGVISDSGLQASVAGRQDTDRKEDAGTAAANEAESLKEPRAETDAESAQTADSVEEQALMALPENVFLPSEEESKSSSFAGLSLNSSQVPAENEAVIPPKPVSNSIVSSSSGFSFMSAKPFTVDGVLTSGYYSSYTRGGSNEAQTIHYVPASAKFDINGFFLTPDLVNYSIQPELNASPQASDAGFQGGNGLRMRIDTLRRQPMLMSFRYADVRLEDAYFGSLSQLSSYTLNNRNKELGMTSQLKLPGLPTATMDWGTNSVMSQSLIPEIPEYVSKSDHRNIDVTYQKWGWDFRGSANRQQQTSNLYTPGEGRTDSSILHQKLKQYRGSLRWNSLRDLELSLDAGNQSTSNFLLNRPIRLTSSFGNVNLRLFQRRRWKTSLRAGYTSNISDLLLTSLITDLSATGSVAPDESILSPIQRTTSSLNLGGYTSVDLSHGLSTYASVDRTEVSPAGNIELRSRNLTATAGMAYSKIFGWGNISGQYGRSYGNGSVTGQRGRIDGQNYAVTVQPGRWEALQLDFSLRGTDQRIVNELPVHNKTFAFEGNVGFRVFGGLRSRIGGGWQKSSLTNADNSFLTEGYSARAALEHPRFQIAGSLNSVLGSPLQAYDQVLGGIGIDPTLLTPLQIAPSIFRGFTLSVYAVPIRMLELSTLYTRSLQRRDGVFGNDFETIDAAAKFNFRNLKFEAGYFRSAQVYTNNQVINPETERGRFYFRISRTFKF